MKLIGNKKQHQLALRIVENYIIGKAAILDASTDDFMSIEQINALEHLASNTVSLLTAVVGVKGLKYYTNKYGLGVSKL